MIYKELENRNYKRMSHVVIIGSSTAIFLYAMVGIFGYLTFVHVPELLTQNILDAPYHGNIAIMIVKLLLSCLSLD